MNNSASEGTTSTAMPLSKAEKVKLLQQMYSRTHWIELIRLFGYQTLPMVDARQAIEPLAEKYGKEPVANACEALVDISVKDQVAFARLKPHVRRLAFQILGPEPTSNPLTEAIVGSVPEPNPQSEDTPPSKPVKKRKPKKDAASETTSADQHAPKGSGTVLEQYRSAKERHPNMLLLFRMGDFYEMFAEDAEIASKLLGLTLTTRDRTLVMAGFPHHQLEAYLHKLLHAGQRVAVCDQVDESVARGPIRCEVTPETTKKADKARSRKKGG